MSHDRPSIEGLLDRLEGCARAVEAWTVYHTMERRRRETVALVAAREALLSRFLEQQRDAEAWRRFRGWWLAEDFPQTASDIGQPEGTPQK